MPFRPVDELHDAPRPEARGRSASASDDGGSMPHLRSTDRRAPKPASTARKGHARQDRERGHPRPLHRTRHPRHAAHWLTSDGERGGPTFRSSAQQDLSDALADGRRFRVLCVIDNFSRECLAAVVDTSISGIRVASELDRIAEKRRYPCIVVSDNHCPTGDLQSKSAERGTELTLNAMLKWQEERQVEWHYIAPGKPMQNELVESFDGCLRDKCLKRAPVPDPAPCPPIDCAMARRLQPSPPTLEPRRAHTTGVSLTAERNQTPNKAHS